MKTRRVLSHGVGEHATSITSSRRSLKVLRRVGNVDGSRRRSSSRSSFFGTRSLCTVSSLFLFGERLYTTCFGWEIENNDAKGWAGVGKISLGGCCYGGVGNVVYDKVIS